MKERKRPAGRARLPLLLGLCGALLLVGIVGVLLSARSEPAPAAGDPSAPGRLIAGASTVDLGRVPFDKQVEGRFELTNSGGGTVRLVGKAEVKTLEGC